jgi:hypothetical protein
MSKRSAAHERQKRTEMPPWQQKKKINAFFKNYNHLIVSIYFLNYLVLYKKCEFFTVIKKINFNAVACLHLRLSCRSRLPGAFQKFTKFYQFCGGYLSSLGAPKHKIGIFPFYDSDTQHNDIQRNGINCSTQYERNSA